MEENQNLNLKTDPNLILQKLNFFSSKLIAKSKSESKEEFKRIEGLGYENASDGFIQEYSSSNYIQYSHVYHLRLNEIKLKLISQAEYKWKNTKVCKNILDVKGKVL